MRIVLAIPSENDIIQYFVHFQNAVLVERVQFGQLIFSLGFGQEHFGIQFVLLQLEGEMEPFEVLVYTVNLACVLTLTDNHILSGSLFGFDQLVQNDIQVVHKLL